MTNLHKKIKKLTKPMLYASVLTMAIGIGSASLAEEPSSDKNYFNKWGTVDQIKSPGEGRYHSIQLGDLDGDGDLDLIVITNALGWNEQTIIKIYENRIPQKNK